MTPSRLTGSDPTPDHVERAGEPDQSSAGEVKARASLSEQLDELRELLDTDAANSSCGAFIRKHGRDLLARVTALEAAVLMCQQCCERPATCIGAYEGAEVETPACDVCCGHGNEDGHCQRLALRERAEAAEAKFAAEHAMRLEDLEDQFQWQSKAEALESQVHALTAQLKHKEEELARMVSQRHGVSTDEATASPDKGGQ